MPDSRLGYGGMLRVGDGPSISLKHPSEREATFRRLMKNPDNVDYGENHVKEAIELWYSSWEGDDLAVNSLADYLEEFPPPKDWAHRNRLQVVSQVNRGRLDRELPMVAWDTVQGLLGKSEHPWPYAGMGSVNLSVGADEGNWQYIKRNLTDTDLFNPDGVDWCQIVLKGEVFRGKPVDPDGNPFPKKTEIVAGQKHRWEGGWVMTVADSLRPYLIPTLGHLRAVSVDRKMMTATQAEYQFSYRRPEARSLGEQELLRSRRS